MSADMTHDIREHRQERDILMRLMIGRNTQTPFSASINTDSGAEAAKNICLRTDIWDQMHLVENLIRQNKTLAVFP